MARTKSSGERFVVVQGGQRLKETTSKGAALSRAITAVEATRPRDVDADAEVVFEPVVGPSATAFRVERRERVTRTVTVEDLD